MAKRKTIKEEEQSEAISIDNPIVKEYFETNDWLTKHLIKLVFKIFSPKLKIKPIKKPLLILIRTNKTAEFYENATQGTFRYVHSNGQEKEIELTPNKLIRLNYKHEKDKEIGRYTVSTYIIEENQKFPLPEEPVIDAEQVKFIFNKSLSDQKAFDAKLKKIEMEGWQQIILAIGALALVIFGIEFLGHGTVSNFISNILGKNKETVKEIATNATQNVTIYSSLLMLNIKKIMQKRIEYGKKENK